MSNRTREIKRRVREALEEERATSLFFSILNNSHQRYDFQVDGERGWFTFASTPRSSQAVVNAAMAARRAVRRRREEAALRRSEVVKAPRPLASTGKKPDPHGKRLDRKSSKEL